MGEDSTPRAWEGDLLGFRVVGETFSNLIRSIDDSKVISIEAGFGCGKTFFRESWATQLRDAGEVVIEIDAQQSDHSGDPVVTFLAALMETMEPAKKSQWTKAIAKGTGVAISAAKIVASVAARKAGEEAVDGIEEWLKSDGDESDLDKVISEFGKEASRSLTAQLAAQFEAERIRTRELPDQMKRLREALTDKSDTNRVVILIDELDRCHPDYAILLLEAMKLVFNQDGFVFVIFMNANQLERLAGHLFGSMESDERYLEKFVDIRLKLPSADENIGNAAFELASRLPYGRMLSESVEFSAEQAAELARELAPVSNLSMRQIKRLLLKVEVALRCYPDVPIDAPLLIFLAFQDALEPTSSLPLKHLPRAKLTKFYLENLKEKQEQSSNHDHEMNSLSEKLTDFIHKNCREILTIPNEYCNLPDSSKRYKDWARIMFLAETYITSHQDVLYSVHQISVE